jgi:hypothetical protein
VIDAVYARRYFFLFDDFALIGQASTIPVRGIFSEPWFGFYRPLVFLLVKAESSAFGWRHPAAYISVSLAMHAAIASLTFGVLRRFGLSAFAAATGAVLFAASPWSSEAQFWLSGRFDVLSAFGTLVCLSAVLSIREGETAPRAILLGALAVASACVALLSKENALAALPVLIVAAWVALRGVRAERAGWIAAAAVIAVAAAYLFVRSRLLPGLGGAYGDAWSLLKQAPLMSNALGYVRAFVTVPLPWIAAGAQPGQIAILSIAAAALAIVVVALRRHAGLTITALLGFAAAIAPTLWLAPIPFATSTGRFMYLPGLCGCLVLAAAIDSLACRGRRVRILATVLAGAVLAVAVESVRYQASVWSRATSLARDAIEQFRPLVGRGASAVFIPNLPFWFAGGPYVLKDYAFTNYFGSAPPVRTRNMVLEVDHGRTRFAGWVTASGLPEASPPAPPTPAERVLALRLGVTGTPSYVEVRPSRISIFATPDARRVADVPVAVSSLTAWRAEPSDPALFAVEPTRGTGPATLRVVPVSRGGALDRIASVTFRGDDPEAAEATLTVRLRITPVSAAAPPFGSLDAPAAATISAQQPGALIFQGWALDDFSLRRVYGEARDAAGTRVPLGDAIRGGERPDVSQAFPNAHDLYRARWILQIDAVRIAPLRTPITVEIFAEDADGLKTRLGVRTIR